MDASHEFILRTVSHTRSNYRALCQKLHRYFLKGTFTDVIMKSGVDQREFKCHKLILAAACEYLDTMFSGNWRESYETVLNFKDIAGDSLELFLQFAYQGAIVLSAENIFAALCLSDRFRMTTLEDLCVRYLTERHVPSYCAVELFVFACRANKTSLIPMLSDFILNRLRKLWRDAGENVLLNMTLTDLKTLLTNRGPLSTGRERFLRLVLVHWVSEYYTLEKHSVLEELLSIGQFRNSKVRPDFFKRLLEKDISPCPVEIKSREWLHVYVESKANTCSLRTVEAVDEDGLYFYQPVPIALGDVCKMKTLTLRNQLYLYALHPGRCNDYQLKFSVYSSVSFTDKQTLKRPGNCSVLTIGRGNGAKQAFNAASISGDPVHRTIFLLHALERRIGKELFMYDCATDSWYSKDYRRDGVEAEVITYLDNRLYSFGKNKTVYAFDFRAARWEKLCNSGLFHSDSDRFSGHKRKLYATGRRERVNRYGDSHVVSEVYDPVADRWREVSPYLVPSEEILDAEWLVSLENKLWLFGTNADCKHRFQRYDSFLKEWDGCRRVFKYAEEESTIMDIVVSGSEY